MNKDFLARFGITEYHFENPNGAYRYAATNEYITDGEKYVLGAKKDSMYLDNATWLLVKDKEKNEISLYTLIESESELKKILSKYSKEVEKVNPLKPKIKEARINAIRAKLNSLNRRKVSSVRELTEFITKFRMILENNIDYLSDDMNQVNDFIDPGATTHFEEHDDKVDFYLLSRNGEKLLIIKGSYN